MLRYCIYVITVIITPFKKYLLYKSWYLRPNVETSSLNCHRFGFITRYRGLRTPIDFSQQFRTRAVFISCIPIDRQHIHRWSLYVQTERLESLLKEVPMKSQLLCLAFVVILINVHCYIPIEKLTASPYHKHKTPASILLAGYDHNDDVKTVDILSLETIRSTLVRQGLSRLQSVMSLSMNRPFQPRVGHI